MLLLAAADKSDNGTRRHAMKDYHAAILDFLKTMPHFRAHLTYACGSIARIPMRSPGYSHRQITTTPSDLLIHTTFSMMLIGLDFRRVRPALPAAYGHRAFLDAMFLLLMPFGDYTATSSIFPGQP